MICLPCKGCGADLGYGDQWPWGDPFLPSKPYFWDGSAWCKMCYNKGTSQEGRAIHVSGGQEKVLAPVDFVTPSVYNDLDVNQI